MKDEGKASRDVKLFFIVREAFPHRSRGFSSSFIV
jgi:hypothetical protein